MLMLMSISDGLGSDFESDRIGSVWTTVRAEMDFTHKKVTKITKARPVSIKWHLHALMQIPRLGQPFKILIYEIK